MTGAPEDRHFVAFDKTPLHYILHEPSGPPAATLLVIHGAGEHAARYNAFASYLAARQIRSALLDLRGYGQSGGPRAFARSFDDYREDVLALARKLKADGKGPLFVLAHSMGALVAAHAFSRNPEDAPRGLILSSPCFGLAFKIPAYLEWIARISSVLQPRLLHPTRVWPEILMHDEALIQEYRQDTLLVHRMSSRLFVIMSEAMKRSKDTAGGLPFPVLIVQAGADQVVDPAASRAFFEALPGPDKTFKIYPGLYHEVLNEPSREAIYNEILTWIQKRCK